VQEPTPSGFLNDSYLVGSAAACQLHRTIRDLPILNAHNPADVVEIGENRPWTDIWQVEGATDHCCGR
jgi:glucuronate isomerase